MTASLRALMHGLIDYAGLFPPAKLPLDEAIRNYAAYRAHADAWMLGRFIIPAARLGELEPFAPLFRAAPPFEFTVLGRGGKTSKEFRTALRSDLDAVAAFLQLHGDCVRVPSLEVRLPDATDFGIQWEVQHVANEMHSQQGPPRTTHFEIGFAGIWRECLENVLTAFAAVNEGQPGPFQPPAGFKLRCGGLEASAFPSAEQVAAAIASCRDHRVTLKATAGLHHPIRLFHDSVQTKMHGFVNVFGAAILAHVHTFDEARLVDLLLDENPHHFKFDDAGFHWREWSVTPDLIASSRQFFALGFGSCSFDEPRDDLKALGWA